MQRRLRDGLGERLGAAGRAVRLLYGGGVDHANAAVLPVNGVDGLLVGRAAWSAHGLCDILARS
jgi:triosephosphate isomerase